MQPSPERTELEQKTLVSANWMLEKNEYFPDELAAFRDEMLVAKADPFQLDDANLLSRRK